MSRSSKKVLLQVLWTGVDESAPCLYLFTDTKRYPLHFPYSNAGAIHGMFNS